MLAIKPGFTCDESRRFHSVLYQTCWWTYEVQNMEISGTLACAECRSYLSFWSLSLSFSSWWRSWSFLSSNVTKSIFRSTSQTHLTRTEWIMDIEFCDHISSAPDSAAGTPISYHTVENVISSWNCRISAYVGWGGPEWLLSHGEKSDGTKFHRLQSQERKHRDSFGQFGLQCIFCSLACPCPLFRWIKELAPKSTCPDILGRSLTWVQNITELPGLTGLFLAKAST